MSVCEKCWEDAHTRSKVLGKTQQEQYSVLLQKRKYNPCSPKQQTGQFWDGEKQCDRRDNKVK